MHNERLLFIDIAKGLGILLVVVGHISWGAYTSETHTVINIFHMPLFFYVSTLFFKRINFIELIIKKAKRLLVPYLLYGFLALMLYLYITPPQRGYLFANYLVLFGNEKSWVYVFFNFMVFNFIIWSLYIILILNEVYRQKKISFDIVFIWNGKHRGIFRLF